MFGIYLLVFAAVLALCMAGLGIGLLLRKNGRFPETEIGRNKNMRKLGITCAKQEAFKQHRQHCKQPVQDCSNCTACTISELRTKS